MLDGMRKNRKLYPAWVVGRCLQVFYYTFHKAFIVLGLDGLEPELVDVGWYGEKTGSFTQLWLLAGAQ